MDKICVWVCAHASVRFATSECRACADHKLPYGVEMAQFDETGHFERREHIGNEVVVKSRDAGVAKCQPEARGKQTRTTPAPDAAVHGHMATMWCAVLRAPLHARCPVGRPSEHQDSGTSDPLLHCRHTNYDGVDDTKRRALTTKRPPPLSLCLMTVSARSTDCGAFPNNNAVSLACVEGAGTTSRPHG